MASTYLTRTQTTGNRTTFTFSAWVKRSGFGTQHLITCGASSTYMTQFQFNSSDQLQFYSNDNGSTMHLQTNRKFLDTNAWYHIMLRFDTTQSTTNDRIRFYVNGEQETSFATQDQPSQNADNTQFNYNGVAVDIGRRHHDNSDYFNGIMSHVHFCDGTSLAPTVFGTTDSTTGEWKINTGATFTPGNNGFTILKDGNTITDQSSNSNNFSLGGGTLTKTEDCPSDVFCTYNVLHKLGDHNIFSNGNTVQKQTSDVGQRQGMTTLGAHKGKYYAEFKLANIGSNVGGSYPYVGTVLINNYTYNTYLGNNGIAMHPGGNIYRAGNVVDSQTSITYTTGDIVSVALDRDNLKVHFRVNGGTWLASGDPANNTGGYDISAFLSNTDNDNFITFATSVYNNNGEWNANFGNGYFKTTAVSSAGTNASNIGIFEYDVPAGYTALSTKGLNSF